MIEIEEGQVWRDRYMRSKGVRFVRIDKIETALRKRFGVTVPLRVLRVSSRYDNGPWTPTIRFIRANRLTKFFELQVKQ